jgi:hypothetical protein
MPMHKTVAEDAYRGNKLYVPGKYTYTQLHTQSAASVPRHSHRAKDLNCPQPGWRAGDKDRDKDRPFMSVGG